MAASFVTPRPPVREYRACHETSVPSSPSIPSATSDSPGHEDDRSSIEPSDRTGMSSIPTSPPPTQASSSTYWGRGPSPELGSSPYARPQLPESGSRADPSSYCRPVLEPLSMAQQNSRSLNSPRAYANNDHSLSESSSNKDDVNQADSFLAAQPRGTKRQHSSTSTFIRRHPCTSARRHTGCMGGSATCTDPTVSFTVISHPHSSKLLGQVYSDQRFGKSEASVPCSGGAPRGRMAELVTDLPQRSEAK